MECLLFGALCDMVTGGEDTLVLISQVAIKFYALS